MNARELQKPQKRVKPTYLSRLNLQGYDASNLYPQYLLQFLDASPTGGTCFDRFATFIEGRGIADEAIAGAIVNHSRERWEDIHHLCAEDFARFNGFALHITYNAFCDIAEVRALPFESLRLFEPDADGYVSKIAYFPDWSEEATRDGKKLRVSEETLDVFDIYNPNKEVVAAQIRKAGGVEFYNGQILYYTNKGYNIYPKPIYDRILNELSVDEGISNVKNRNVKNNFLPAGMLIHKGRNASSYGSEQDIDERLKAQREADGFSDALAALQGDTNACNLLEVSIDYDEDKPAFEPIQVANYDKVFEATESSTIERIYAAFGQEAFYCLRVGKIGFSGNLIADAKREYAEQQVRRQKALERIYNDVLSHMSPDVVPAGATIELLPYVDLTTPVNATR